MLHTDLSDSCSYTAPEPKSVILKLVNPQTISVKKKQLQIKNFPKQKIFGCNHFGHNGELRRRDAENVDESVFCFYIMLMAVTWRRPICGAKI